MRKEEEMSPEPTTTTSSADALTSRLTRTVLQQSPSSIPGREIVQVLTEIPAGVESGWHIHPGEEVGYIVAGTVRMMIEGRSPLMLPAGSPFLIPIVLFPKRSGTFLKHAAPIVLYLFCDIGLLPDLCQCSQLVKTHVRRCNLSHLVIH